MSEVFEPSEAQAALLRMLEDEYLHGTPKARAIQPRGLIQTRREFAKPNFKIHPLAAAIRYALAYQ